MITLRNSKEPDSLICQFMTIVDDFFAKKTNFKTIGYHESPTDSKKVMRLSVFVTEKDYTGLEDRYAFFREVDKYLHEHDFPYDFDPDDEFGDPSGGNDSESVKDS
jgi:hypothetical protein